MKKWRIEDSEELYNIKGWGVNYFGINEKGHVYVTPKKNSVQVDLKEVVDQLATRHVTASRRPTSASARLARSTSTRASTSSSSPSR